MPEAMPGKARIEGNSPIHETVGRRNTGRENSIRMGHGSMSHANQTQSPVVEESFPELDCGRCIIVSCPVSSGRGTGCRRHDRWVSLDRDFTCRRSPSMGTPRTSQSCVFGTQRRPRLLAWRDGSLSPDGGSGGTFFSQAEKPGLGDHHA